MLLDFAQPMIRLLLWSRYLAWKMPSFVILPAVIFLLFAVHYHRSSNRKNVLLYWMALGQTAIAAWSLLIIYAVIQLMMSISSH